MTDEELFTTFVTAMPEQLIRAIEALLLLPWNAGADASAEHTIEGMTVTSSEDADVHELEFIRSKDFAGDDGERFTAVMNRAAPVVTEIVDATTAAWGEPGVFREAEDPTACTPCSKSSWTSSVSTKCSRGSGMSATSCFQRVRNTTRTTMRQSSGSSPAVLSRMLPTPSPCASGGGRAVDPVRA